MTQVIDLFEAIDEELDSLSLMIDEITVKISDTERKNIYPLLR